ncbi:MAG: bacteriohemerythrin [Candidatus Thorarchaeota archaeon]
MAKIEWEDSLSVGIDLIDEQHKMLIQRLSDLSKAVEQQRAPSEVLKTLDFLVEYTDFHFSTEEKHMVEQEYAGRHYHLQQHEEFKDSLRHLVEDFEDEGATKALGTAINIMLLNWLINHIKGIDVKFGEFLKDKGMIDINEA